MYIIAGLVAGAALPHFRGSFQLASDKHLKITEMILHNLVAFLNILNHGG